MSNRTSSPGLLGLLLASVALAGCADDGTNDPAGPASASIVTTTTTTTSTTTTTTSTTATPPETSATGSTTDVPDTTSAPTTTVAPVVGDPAVDIEVVGEFDEPIDLAVRPGDDALWIVEQSGRVVHVDDDARTTALDLGDRVPWAISNIPARRGPRCAAPSAACTM